MIYKKITIELLEDLHLGTGLGKGDIDSTQLRDKNNNPVIASTHIKGVLKQTALDLHQLAPDFLTKETIYLLFGYKAHHQGQLKLTSAYLESSSVNTLIWGSTRIGENGIADEGSLRQIEYVPAGAKFCLTLALPEKHKNLVEKLDKILSRCSHLGAGRNRGQGLVSWLIKGVPPAKKYKLTVPSHYPARLRLIIKNLEPICLAQTGHPGNLIATESFIPGKAVCGSIVANCIKNNELKLAQQLLTPSLSWGAALPLPEGITFSNENELSKAQVLPIPLSIGTPKTPSGLKNNQNQPWWAFQSKLVNLGDREEIDQLTLVDGEETEKLKRPATNEFVFNTGKTEQWQRYKPQIMERLRNQVPSAENNYEQALFSNEEIAEETNFISDILVTDKEQATALCSVLRNIGENWLHIGRGGKPATIEQACWINLKDSHSKAVDKFNLLLESDLIVRDKFGNFYDRFNEQALLNLAGITEPISIKIEKNYSEGKKLYGFNTSTGLPRLAYQAIKSGSAITVSGNDAEKLFTALNSKLCLGELTNEGYGRFRLNNLPKPQLVNKEIKANSNKQESSKSEQLCNDAKLCLKQFNSRLENISDSQWGDFRNLTLASADTKQLTDVINRFKQAGEKMGGKAWKSFFENPNYHDFEEKITKLAKKEFNDALTFIDFFCRWQRAKAPLKLQDQ